MGPNLRILPSASDVARGKGNELLSEGGFSRGDLVLHFRGWREPNVRPGPSPTPWRSFLGELDGLLKASVELRCLGGFVVTQQYGIGRETSDIDFIAAIAQSPHDDVEALAGLKSKLHRKYRLDMQYVGVATPPAEYASRLTRMFPSAPWKQLKLFALHATDIALSKLERNAERDREWDRPSPATL